MSTIIGDTLLYALGDAVKKQEKINKLLISDSYKDEVSKISDEQLKLLTSLLRLCQRVY